MTTFAHNKSTAKFDENKKLFVDGLLIGTFKGLKEAKEYLESLRVSEEIAKSIQFDLPSKTQLSDKAIALALYESGEKRVTESLVKELRQIVENKKFYPNDVVINLRKSIDHVSMVSGKIDYILEDNSTVYIDIETNQFINNLIEDRDSANLMRFMNSNTRNFLYCVEELLKDS